MTPRINSLISSQSSQLYTVRLADRIRTLERNGCSIIKFNVGDINIPTPDPIIESAYEAMNLGKTQYSSSRGLPELRVLISEKYNRRCNIEVDSNLNILVTSGAIHGVYSTCAALLHAGDEVLVPDPAWPTYRGIVQFVGASPVPYPFPRDGQDAKLESDALVQHLTENTKMIVVNSPSNPTGYELTEAEIEALTEVAIEHDLWILLDDIYSDVRYDDRRIDCLHRLSDVSDRLIVISGFSKAFAMTGWRIGYIIAPANVINEALKVCQLTITNVSTFSQYGAMEALREFPHISEHIISKLSERASVMWNLLKQIESIKVEPVYSGLYFFPIICELDISLDDFCLELLDNFQTALIPGTVYGERGENRIRLSFGNVNRHEITDGMNRLAEAISFHRRM